MRHERETWLHSDAVDTSALTDEERRTAIRYVHDTGEIRKAERMIDETKTRILDLTDTLQYLAGHHAALTVHANEARTLLQQIERERGITVLIGERAR